MRGENMRYPAENEEEYKKNEELKDKVEEQIQEEGWMPFFRSFRFRDDDGKYRLVDFEEFDFVCGHHTRRCTWLFVKVTREFDGRQWARMQYWGLLYAPPNSIFQVWVWDEKEQKFNIHERKASISVGGFY